ncbi:methyltransferase domain-containing protein [Ilumatobacter sp.]|uniref:methyltransferase domain-containing protein n=1 Tax=Ilumatobacter sp. TaxID=1967498 RepID=UPI003C4983DD
MATRELAERLDVRSARGIDSSRAMIEKARRATDDRCTFAPGDIADWSGAEPVDLIVANASLQWVPDHSSVLARWVAQLAPDGQLAVQVPANSDHPSHTCSAAVANREPFHSAMGGTPPPDPVADNVLAPEAYAELLHDLGFGHPEVRMVVYPQVMESSASVVE